MAARSTQITIINGTDYELEYTNSHLDHGVWNGGPEINVMPHSVRVVAQNDSDGLATGAEGKINYNIIDFQHPGGLGSVTVHWNNPYVGGNSYSSVVSNGKFAICYCGNTGSGDNAQVTFMICQI